MVKSLVEAAITFWNEFLIGSQESDPDAFITIRDEALEGYVKKYKLWDAQEKEATKSKAALREKILSFSDDGNFYCYGLKCTKEYGRKTIDHKKMIDDGIELGKYSKISPPFYRITIMNEIEEGNGEP
jgi:hypothetical protein